MNIQKSETLAEYIKGMNKFRAQLVQPAKDSDNPFFKSKYVDLAGVQVAIDNALVGTGLTYQQWEESREDGATGVGTIVMHEKGEYIAFPPYYMKAEKQTPQGQGSAITYLRRYTLSTVFGVTSDVDDDGNVASGNINRMQGQRANQGRTISEPTKAEAINKMKDLKKSIAEIKKTTQKQVDEWLFNYMNIKNINEITDMDGWSKAVKYLITLESKAKEQAKAGG